MLIDIVTRDAERALLAVVEQNGQRHTLRGVVHFRSAGLKRKPHEDSLLLTLRPLLQDKHAALYFFHNGDLAITWNGVQKSILEDICKRLYAYFHLSGDEALHTYYDVDAHGEDLRRLLHERIASLPVTTPSPTQAAPITLAFTADQRQHIRKYGAERQTFKAPTVLVVEDQEFSRKLLEGMLRRTHVCYAAANAVEALALYAEHVPCITFLDIELPDVGGHELAAFIKQHDPESFVVMVTANNYIEDVTRAKQNGAKGFIAKPYSKQKILEGIEKYARERKIKP